LTNEHVEDDELSHENININIFWNAYTGNTDFLLKFKQIFSIVAFSSVE